MTPKQVANTMRARPAQGDTTKPLRLAAASPVARVAPRLQDLNIDAAGKVKPRKV